MEKLMKTVLILSLTLLVQALASRRQCRGRKTKEYTLTEDRYLTATIPNDLTEMTVCMHGIVNSVQVGEGLYAFYSNTEFSGGFGITTKTGSEAYGITNTGDKKLVPINSGALNRIPSIFSNKNLNCFVITPTFLQWYSSAGMDGTNSGVMQLVDEVTYDAIETLFTAGQMRLFLFGDPAIRVYVGTGTLSLVNVWDSALTLDKISKIDCKTKGNVASWPKFKRINWPTSRKIRCRDLFPQDVKQCRRKGRNYRRIHKRI